MQIQNHIGKISWTLANRSLYFLYFFVLLVQINALKPEEYGLFELLRNLNIWMLGLTDSLILQGLIQFGMKEEDRSKVNTITIISYSVILVSISILIYFFRESLSLIFNEPNLVYMAINLPLLTLFSIPRNYIIKLLWRDYLLSRVFFIDLIYFVSMTVLTFFYIFHYSNLNFQLMVNILLTGTALSSILAIILAYKKLQFSFVGGFSLKQLFGYGTPLMLQGIFHSLPKYLDVFIVQYFFNTGTVGIYSLTKNLYRVFDDAISTVYGLIFPTTVKQFVQSNRDEIISIMTKSVSFTFILFLAIAIILQAGLSEFLITTFLPERYYATIIQFNIALIGAIFLPFLLFTAIITASGKPQINMIFSMISAIISIAGFIFVGIINNSDFIPIGIILYNLSMGILTYIYVKRIYGFPIKMIFRSINDSKEFLKRFLKK